MFIRSVATVISLLLLVSFSGCGNHHQPQLTFQYQEDDETSNLLHKINPYPATRFLVLSDPHYYHTSLGTEGQAFQNYLEEDRKLLILSDKILDSAIERINLEEADFILICGDLTKDGERINHDYFAAKLKNINSTSRIYVIPGNHDVSNGASYRYTEDGTEKVPTIGPDEFREIYRQFGYQEALTKDLHSLSYIVEPVAGLWLVALDSCLWRENNPDEHPQTDGRFTVETLRWLEEALIEAKRKGKAVAAFMHHGLMEHYPTNEKYYGAYIVDDSRALTDLMANYGVRLVFTGHFHAQDITLKHLDVPGRFVFDIETGSLVTYPCPYRIVTISPDQVCTIESRNIESLETMQTGFPGYARDFVYKGTVKMADNALKKYKVSSKGMARLSPQIADAYLAHLAGDERKPEKTISGQGAGLMGRVVLLFQKDLINGWWTDLPPKDNHLVIDLNDGSFR